jgi:hypothetical protein
VDYFAVYAPDTDKVYLVPISHVGKTEMKLRLVAPVFSIQEIKELLISLCPFATTVF